LLDDADEAPLLMSGRSGKQNVAMVKEMISSYCGAYPLKSYCKDSKISDTKGRDNFIPFHQI